VSFDNLRFLLVSFDNLRFLLACCGVPRFNSETNKYISAAEVTNINVSINVHFLILAHTNAFVKSEFSPEFSNLLSAAIATATKVILRISNSARLLLEVKRCRDLSIREILRSFNVSMFASYQRNFRLAIPGTLRASTGVNKVSSRAFTHRCAKRNI
jgi:hypothetical protein